MKSIAELIKAGRKNKDITKSELARQLNVTPTAVSSWESDQKIPSGDTLLKLAQILDIGYDLFPKFKNEKIIQEEIAISSIEDINRNTKIELEEVKKRLTTLEKILLEEIGNNIQHDGAGNLLIKKY